MANIALTHKCNLRCPYCFAGEFVGEADESISLESFDAAVEFLTRRGPATIGIIGGEPTLHPDFGTMLQRLADNPRVAGATVYTNGILLDRSFGLVEHPKLSLLVNWNSPDIIGQKAFAKTMENVDDLVFRRGMEKRINLGLNLYDTTMDYGYMLDLLTRYGFDKLRISITVPDFSKEEPGDVMAYFQEKKPFLMELFRALDGIGVLPYYDCNRPPSCIWSPEELAWLQDYAARHGKPDSSIAHTKSFCRPVIDILPNLQAIRCFGMSEFAKADIREFADAEALTAHFMRIVDRPSFRVFAKPECENCYLRRQWLCTQGCIAFKAGKLEQA
ncbi:radical SAM protein [Adlercreutzia aquisgranensis]|uniref:radical SAM protein n=1 Tax=Adlercreutzia aquisgranensis TaxID=2941323 RepID=UPI00203BEC85|nr:radical SAM protein [Adlercreutzia aquisgranensis]